jgi:hypothetical protein
MDTLTIINIIFGVVNAIAIYSFPITPFTRTWGALGWFCATLGSISLLTR